MHQQLLHAEALGLVWHRKQGHLYALLARLESVLPWLDECEEALAQPEPRG
jgi:hypothetical protein